MIDVKKPFRGILVFTLVLQVSSAHTAPKPASSRRPAAARTAGAPAASAATPGAILLDNFETVDWAPSKHEATTLSLDRAPGKEGSALKIIYDLKDSKQWVSISKSFSIESLKGKALEFWIKGKGNLNTLEIKLVDADGTNFGVKKPDITNAAEWTRVTLTETDFTYWWGGDSVLGPVHDIYFAISAGKGGAGEVLLDELKLVSAVPAGPSKKGVLFDGETTQGWAPAHPEGAQINLSVDAGQNGKAMVINYSIPENQWVSIRRTVNLTLTPAASFVFFLKGQGAPNNVEFKLVDRDESNFGVVLEGKAGDNVWQEIRVPVSELKYLWGGDNRLDLTLIRYIDIAVSGPGGKGKVYLDDLKLVQ